MIRWSPKPIDEYAVSTVPVETSLSKFFEHPGYWNLLWLTIPDPESDHDLINIPYSLVRMAALEAEFVAAMPTPKPMAYYAGHNTLPNFKELIATYDPQSLFAIYFSVKLQEKGGYKYLLDLKCNDRRRYMHRHNNVIDITSILKLRQKEAQHESVDRL